MNLTSLSLNSSLVWYSLMFFFVQFSINATKPWSLSSTFVNIPAAMYLSMVSFSFIHLVTGTLMDGHLRWLNVVSNLEVIRGSKASQLLKILSIFFKEGFFCHFPCRGNYLWVWVIRGCEAQGADCLVEACWALLLAFH